MCPSSHDILSSIKQNQDSILAKGLHRTRRVIETAQGPVIKINGKNVINFCSNDYLGLANHPAIIEAFKRGADKFGVGSGASQLICGYSTAHKTLENRLAEFTRRQSAVIFSSGYLANLAIVNTLLGKDDTVVEDRLNHASMIDAALLSRAKLKRFHHISPGSLEEILSKIKSGKKLVMTDGVFSMDGDIAPLDTYTGVCANHNAWLVVDDAHGFGVLGNNGAGTLEKFNLNSKQVPLLMATFGKALGTYGAFIAGDQEVIDCLVQSARTLIYTTAPPPALITATLQALDIVEEEDWRREKLRELIAYYREQVKKNNLSVSESITPIQPLIIGETDRALRISEQLLQKGLFVQAIRPPTVPAGTSRLRITFSAGHEKEHIDMLVTALQEII